MSTQTWYKLTHARTSTQQQARTTSSERRTEIQRGPLEQRWVDAPEGTEGAHKQPEASGVGGGVGVRTFPGRFLTQIAVYRLPFFPPIAIDIQHTQVDVLIPQEKYPRWFLLGGHNVTTYEADSEDASHA